MVKHLYNIERTKWISLLLLAFIEPTAWRIRMCWNKREAVTLSRGRQLRVGEKCGTIENLSCLSQDSLSTTSWLSEGLKLLNLLYLKYKMTPIEACNSEAWHDDTRTTAGRALPQWLPFSECRIKLLYHRHCAFQ